MIRNILFDIDDTLLDFKLAERAAVSRAFVNAGLSPDEKMLRRYSEINDGQWAKLERGEISRAQVLISRFELLFAELGISADAQRIQNEYEYLLGIGHWFIDGAPELLEALFGKYRLYIVSNGTASVQEGRIKSAELARYFDGIFISEYIGFEKPTREFFECCFARIPNFEKRETVIVGDRLSSDILGGINAGISTVWFNPHGAAGSSEIIPDYEIRALAELPEIIEKI